MMYATLLAQAALVASLALFGSPASTAAPAQPPIIAATGAPAVHDKSKLRCRLYFGCVPASSTAVDSFQD